MSRAHKGRFVLAVMLAMTVIGAPAAVAATWSESPDAGDLPATAQTPAGAGNLTQVSGAVPTDNDVDKYRICISSPAAFSAQTSGSVIDPQQFLFDAEGIGVVGNDDIVEGVQRQSRIPAGNPNNPTTPGVYYLALSRWNNEPLSVGGNIFPDLAQGTVGPTGPGGGSPVTAWSGQGDAANEGGGSAYTITLTGTRFCAQLGTIDIKPGSSTNAVNLKSKGVIPVAVLTTADFDATTIDPASACFGDAESPAQRDCSEAHGRGHFEDVDGDGDTDLMLHFNTQETGIDPTDTQACLTANAASGETIAGCDAIAITP